MPTTLPAPPLAAWPSQKVAALVCVRIFFAQIRDSFQVLLFLSPPPDLFCPSKNTFINQKT